MVGTEGTSTWTNFLSDFGWGASWAGTAVSAVSAFYAAEAQKGQLRQQALAADHQAAVSALNAQRAESDAQAVLSAGQSEKGALTLRQGQESAALRAGQAASGTTGGGSNAEARASQRLIQRIEAMNIDSNTVRQANALRTQSTDLRGQAILARTSAQNIRDTAAGINPWLAAGTSLLGSTGTLSSQWAYRNRYSRR